MHEGTMTVPPTFVNDRQTSERILRSCDGSHNATVCKPCRSIYRTLPVINIRTSVCFSAQYKSVDLT